MEKSLENLAIALVVLAAALYLGGLIHGGLTELNRRTFETVRADGRR